MSSIALDRNAIKREPRNGKPASRLFVVVIAVLLVVLALELVFHLIIAPRMVVRKVDIIAELVAEGNPAKLITRIGERGLGSAVVHGFKESRGDAFVCMDADLSHPPEAIPKLLSELCNEEVDFVIGSRYVAGGTTEENWGLLRRLNSKVAILLARPFTRAKDPISGFFAIRRNVFERGISVLNPIGYKIGLELIVKCGCTRIHEVPIYFVNRKSGWSKLNFKERFNYIRHINHLLRYKFSSYWLLRQNKPVKN